MKIGVIRGQKQSDKRNSVACLLSCVLIGWKIVCVKLFFYWVGTVYAAGQSAALRQIRSNQLVSWSLVDEQFAEAS